MLFYVGRNSITSINMSNSDDDDDWFNKDENEIERNLEEHFKRQTELESQAEHIEYSNAVANAYLGQLDESACAYDTYGNHYNACRISTAQLEKALAKDSLDMFYYISSLTCRDVFVDQLVAGDSSQRIFVYIQIVTSLCKLELPGFNTQWLENFFKQIIQLEAIKRYIEKLFKLLPIDNWIPESKQLLCNIRWMILRAHNLGVLREQGYKFVQSLCVLYKQTQASKNPLCIEFVEALKKCSITSCASAEIEIYPALDELLYSDNVKPNSDIAPAASDDSTTYIKIQQELLRTNFILPLREFVNSLRTKTSLNDLKTNHLILPGTRLILNPCIGKDQSYSLVNLVCNDDDKAECEKLKIGTLLCFTSSYAFEDLILATVTYSGSSNQTNDESNKTDDKSTRIGIEIVKQCNILNFFDRPFLMFEAPVFFEPYLRVYNQLNMCKIDAIPMQRYIVNGATEKKAPAYFEKLRQYTYNGDSFTPDNPPIQMPLNDMQRAALGAALSSEFCLIQGPPGTGKTHLTVELVKMLIESNTGPIIVLTHTNESLDKFLLKASKHTQNILRFGSQIRQPEIVKFNMRNSMEDANVPHRVRQLYEQAKKTYTTQCKKLQDLQNVQNDSLSCYQQLLTTQQQLLRLKTLHTLFQYYAARDKDIIGMTTACAARLNFLLKLLKSKVFIFEEASEIHESHVVACLTPFTEHVVMIGDHKQLRPNTAEQGSKSQISLFERLIDHGYPLSVLNMQYRMRSCIADLLVPTIYEKLICDASVLEYQDVRKMAKNLYFVMHTEPEYLVGKSFVNKHEANELVQLTQHLILEANYQQSDIIILSFYGAQARHIKTLLPKSLDEVCVSTVDSFQGLEANIVLLSLVRSNDSSNIGFLSVPNRCCVALSRARWALYMIGNMDALQQGSWALWSAIRSKLQASNSIGDAFPIVKH